MSDPIQNRPDCIKYPAWQPECRAVMLETDPSKVREKFKVAEETMAQRALELQNSEEDLEERAALQEEREAMEVALAEILAQHPELQKKNSAT